MGLRLASLCSALGFKQPWRPPRSPSLPPSPSHSARRDGAGPLRSALRGKQAQREALARAAEAKGRAAAEVEAGLAEVEAGAAALRAELGTELMATLSRGERGELSALQPALAALQEELAGCRRGRKDVAAAAEALQALLSSNLRRRVAELEDAAAGEEAAGGAAALEARQAEAQAVRALLWAGGERERGCLGAWPPGCLPCSAGGAAAAAARSMAAPRLALSCRMLTRRAASPAPAPAGRR